LHKVIVYAALPDTETAVIDWYGKLN